MNGTDRRLWRQAKTAVLQRDGRCVRCGSPDAVDAHHRTPRGSGGTSDVRIAFGLDNLIALCRSCHTHVESHRTEAIRLGWIVPRGIDRLLAPLQIHGRGWNLLRADATYEQLDSDESLLLAELAGEA